MAELPEPFRFFDNNYRRTNIGFRHTKLRTKLEYSENSPEVIRVLCFLEELIESENPPFCSVNILKPSVEKIRVIIKCYKLDRLQYSNDRDVLIHSFDIRMVVSQLIFSLKTEDFKRYECYYAKKT